MNVVGFHIVEGFPLPNAIKSEDKSEYIFDVSTFDKISSSPLLRDPYEAICVACKKSKVSKTIGIFKAYPGKSLYRGKGMVTDVQLSINYGLG